MSEFFPGLNRLDPFLSWTWKVSSLEFQTPNSIWYLDIQNEVELQNQCVQFEKLKSTNSLRQKDLSELRQKLDNFCDEAKEATKKAVSKLSADDEAVRDNIKTVAARNAEQEKSVNLLKQDLVEIKVIAAENSAAAKKLEKDDDHLQSGPQKLEVFNQYLASICRRNDSVLDSKKFLWNNKELKQRWLRNVFSRFETKMMNRPATLFEILLWRVMCPKNKSRNITSYWRTLTLGEMMSPSEDHQSGLPNSVQWCSARSV